MKHTNVNNLAQELAEDLITLEATRANILRLLAKYSLDQLNKIPEGFNNNLAWNAGHCWVTQKLLTYGLSGKDTGLTKEVIAAYRKGSAPTAPLSAEEWAQIIEGLTHSASQLKSDLETENWEDHNPYTTSYGVTVSHVRNGVRFNNTHEGMHYGVMLALSKLV